MTEPTVREREELKKAKTHDKKEQLCNISEALAVLASASVRSKSLYVVNTVPILHS